MKLRHIIKHISIYAAFFSAIPMQAQHIYTLQSCLEEGLQNNYSLRIVRNEEQVAHNNATIANAGYLPTLDLSAGYSGSLDDTDTKLRSTGETVSESGAFDQTFNVGLSLNWTIFDGLGIQTNYKKLKELERMGETQTRIVIEDFIAQLSAEYYNFVQQKIRLKNLQYAVSLSRERLRIVEARYNIGSFSRLDLQQARVDFNADQASYIKQQELLHTSRIRLNELMAIRDMNGPVIVVDTLIQPNTALRLERLWGNTLRTNANLLKAEQSQRIAQLDLRAVQSRNYPYVKANAGYGYTHNKYELGANKSRDNLGLNFGVTVGINLFNGNKRRESRNARIAMENAQLEQEELKQGLRADLMNLWQAYQNNIKLLNLERDNLIAARDNYEIARDRYLLGDLSGIEMREAQKSLLDAEERILSAEYDTKMCEISLLQISGSITDYLGTRW
ncbi:MAG: TolC family protein [Bacteroidaceae bacterium]|nr:TolC family protein [Bacteroidaceae bacterium]